MVENIWKSLPRHFTVLAPMEGVTDVVFRQVVARAGRPDLFFTEFTNVSSFASEKGRANALERLDIVTSDNPIIAQIWGKNPEHFAELAKALEGMGFQGLDINMGCPDRHVNKAGGGAAMIKTPDLAIECIRQAKKHTNLPISVKTRLGFTYIDELREWLTILLKEDLSALTVHLRTRKEMTKVPAHFELIPKIIALKEEVSPNTKLVINGDVRDLRHAKELWVQFPQVDGFMIGRGVFSNPYCFSEHVPNREELMELLKYHLDLHDLRNVELENRGSKYSYEPLKRFFKVYLHSFAGASEIRTALMECKNTNEVRKVLGFQSKTLS